MAPRDGRTYGPQGNGRTNNPVMDHPRYEFSNIGAKLDLTTGIILMNQYADLGTFTHQENLVAY